ncbi:MAG: hypothetical protein GWP91_14795 [Rhodobacterales bacterium]|nr:hypothetical protein [Rhodobacterales bacterium]
MALLLLVGCGKGDEPAAGDDDDPPNLDFCDAVAPQCTGDCAIAPASLDHEPWSNWLTSSPALSWPPAAGAIRYEVSVGSGPGIDNISCWQDVGDATEYTLQALWGVADGETYYPNVRSIDAAGVASEAVSSEGWVVDILPPDVPTDLDDSAAPVSGEVSWSHPGTDTLSGFAGYEVAVGTAPGLDDAMPWTDIGADSWATVDSVASESWYWLSVRAVDVAGNRSQPATSEGFIACPTGFAFVPSNEGVGATPFCIARYEMRIAGNDNGDQVWSAALQAESRGIGTPWVNLEKSQARIACDALGFSYQLVTNAQWQATARSIENEPSNWSGGAVGAGYVSRGHSDASPFAALEGDSDPCEGTNNPECEDPSHPDWAQKRTHLLGNGETVWDFAGNAWEQVDGSTGAPDYLWMEYTDGAFTLEPGWEVYRASFAPEGPYDGSHGMGGLYGGVGNLIRGGSYDFPSPGSAGAQGMEDMGIYAGHHNAWFVASTHGFRCAYTPM